MQQCFIVGYPEGVGVRVSERVFYPVWKSGNIASEPRFFVDGVPKILVDATTCAGMSGSPVYASSVSRNRFIGVYTGRTSMLTDLGFVFTTEAICQILQRGLFMGAIPYPNLNT